MSRNFQDGRHHMAINEVLVVKSLEQIKALSSPYRIRILEAFDNKPASAKDISKRLGEPHGRVNYHIKTLAGVGILKLVDVHVKQGVLEKYYMPVAESILLDSSVINPEDTKLRDSFGKATAAIFEKISREFYASVNNAAVTQSKKINYDYEFYLTPEEAEDLNQKIQGLVRDYLSDKKEARPETAPYFIANMIVPTAKTERHDKL